MNVQDKIRDIESAIEIEIANIDIINVRIGGVERIISSYSMYRDSIKYNLEVLKKSKIVVVLSEYRRSKEELASVLKKIDSSRKEIAEYEHQKEHVNNKISFLKKRLHKLKIMSDNVIKLPLRGTDEQIKD
jgi:chromosome segregation ATPase